MSTFALVDAGGEPLRGILSALPLAQHERRSASRRVEIVRATIHLVSVVSCKDQVSFGFWPR